MKIVLVEPGKEARPAEISGSLQSMQQLVGGIIQAIYPWTDPVAMICHDEGKIIGCWRIMTSSPVPSLSAAFRGKILPA